MSIEVTSSQSGRGARRRARAQVWRRFRTSVPGMTGLVILATYGLMAVAHPILLATVWDESIYDPEIGLDLVFVDKLYVNEVTRDIVAVVPAPAVAALVDAMPQPVTGEALLADIEVGLEEELLRVEGEEERLLLGSGVVDPVGGGQLHGRAAVEALG